MKHCKTCKKSYSKNEKFCEDCGSKLVNFAESGGKHKSHTKQPPEEVISPIHETKKERKNNALNEVLIGITVILGVLVFLLILGALWNGFSFRI